MGYKKCIKLLEQVKDYLENVNEEEVQLLVNDINKELIKYNHSEQLNEF